MRSLRLFLTGAGLVYIAAMVAMAVTRTPLGSPLYFALSAVAALMYVATLVRVWHRPAVAPALFFSALAFAVCFRAPLAVAPVNTDNDMIRYLWDGRVQRLGINPYLVLPADPELQWTHTDETRNMPSARHRTSYQPAAQLFFRMVVSFHDSSRAMKLALVLCDLLTILVLWRWLVATGRNEWLTLVYAWNPLVVLEVAHSGHIDALGTLWIAAAAYWLSRRRTALASIAYVLAIAIKPLPVVLAPLFWRRISKRDALLGAALMALLYVPFMAGPQIGLGMDRVVSSIRFNGPIFRAVRELTNPSIAAGFAVGLGVLVAVWCRWKLAEDHPGAWAWPMAIALACGPVIYPWYLLYFSPFLFTVSAVPLIAWTFSVFPVYLVWVIDAYRKPWTVPASVLWFEYGAIILAALGTVLFLRHYRPQDHVDQNPGKTRGEHGN